MVSDFVDQHNGYLRFTEEEHRRACASDASFPNLAWVLLEYGAKCKGYCTGKK